jgi:phosphohistidine phosphatase
MADALTRRLVLLRHAKSAWPDLPDAERPLAKRGRRDAPQAGHWIRQAGLEPDRVVCSTATRARQTWELASAELAGKPPVTFESRVYQASAPQLLGYLRETPDSVGSLLVVGHSPALEELALTLARPDRDGHPAEAAERLAEKFPTAGIAVLEFGQSWADLAPGQARLAEFVIPRG